MVSRLKEASIDCIVNYRDKCVQFPFTKRADKLITGIEYKKEPLKKQKVQQNKKPLYKKMVMTDGEMVKYAVDTSTEPQKLFDYEKFKENITVLIGPEGGFSSNEKEMLLSNPKITSVSLGTRVLRSEVAVISMLACVNLMRD
jgi:RsmE family RNA methyltransferase